MTNHFYRFVDENVEHDHHTINQAISAGLRRYRTTRGGEIRIFRMEPADDKLYMSLAVIITNNGSVVFRDVRAYADSQTTNEDSTVQTAEAV